MMCPQQHEHLPSLPAEWPVARVDDLFQIQTGKQVSKKNRVGPNQRPFLRTRNVYWGRLDLADVDEMHFTKAQEKRLALRTGDLLLCEGGSVGRTAVWADEMAGCYYQNHLHRLRVSDGRVDPHFAMYWFWYAFDLGGVYFGRKNVTTIPNMSKSRLAELPMPCPAFAEQKDIAAVLSATRQAIDQQERLVVLTTELKNALMEKLFSEGVDGGQTKESEIGHVPMSWEVLPLGDCLVRTQYGLSVKGSTSGQYPILRMTNQVNGKISSHDLQWVQIEDEEFQKFRVDHGDLLFNRTNSFDLVGRTSIFDIDGDYVFASYLIRLRTDEERLNPFFLNHYLNCASTQARLKTIATRAVSQSNISATRLKGFLIPLPSPEEQVEIVRTLDILDNKIGLHERWRDALESMFNTLLHELMTGGVRITDLDLGGLRSNAPQREDVA